MGKSARSSLVIVIVLTFIIGFIAYYLLLPPINLKSFEFWFYVLFLMAVFSVFSLGVDDESVAYFSWGSILVVILLLLLIYFFSSSKLMRAKEYADLIEDNIVTDNIENYTPTLGSVPLLDKDSAMLIANRKMGSLDDVVSQFEISDSEQITIKGKPYRVSVVEYAGFFKWLNNKKTGTPGYILVNMQTQVGDLVRVEGGIKYSKSEYFSRDITRYLVFNNRTKMFGEITFELNDEGEPYWIAPIMDKKIGLFGGKDVVGVIVVNAITGEMTEYDLDEIPSWVDNVYESSLLMEQYDYYGKYQDGYFNSIFGQRGIKVTTSGYNYIPIGDDNWIYTGVTSVVSDESNIGFVLMNKRTKEIIYYPLAGAEEYSAMESAEGMVQHLGYTSTFPLLLQIENQPTYVVALKDAGGLVKMFGMVNVEQYQIVATGSTLSETQANYRKLLLENNIEVLDIVEDEIVDEVIKEDLEVIEGKVEDIIKEIKNGNSHFYIKLEGNDIYYEFNIANNDNIIFVSVGDIIKIEKPIVWDKLITPSKLLEIQK